MILATRGARLRYERFSLDLFSLKTFRVSRFIWFHFFQNLVHPANQFCGVEQHQHEALWMHVLCCICPNSDLQAGIWLGSVASSPIVNFPHSNMV